MHEFEFPGVVIRHDGKNGRFARLLVDIELDIKQMSIVDAHVAGFLRTQ